MGSGTRNRYNVALNGRGFILRGSPQNPAYLKAQSGVDLTKVRPDDPAYNPLNGSDWSYWGQTDWSGGFQQLKFKDDATFKDGQAIDVVGRYGQVRLQPKLVQIAEDTISGAYSLGAAGGMRQTDAFFGLQRAGVSKLYRISASVDIVGAISSMAGITGINSMSPFKSALVIGLSRISGTLQTLTKYDRHGGNISLSGFRNTNPVVRSVKGVGIRLYTGEKVTSLSGDVLYYSTDLSTFTSAFQTGRGDRLSKIEDLAGVPYFFVERGQTVEMYRFDEYQGKALKIYTFSDLTSWGVANYLTSLVITGSSCGIKVAFSFDGTRLRQIFADQLFDANYDFSRPFVFEDNVHVKGAMWDGQNWFPGLYGAYGANRATPFMNRLGRAYSIAFSGTTNTRFQVARTSATYASSGHVIGSDFGHDLGQIDKQVNAVIVNCAPLSGGQTIELYRSTDGGQSFTSVGKLSYAQDGAISSKTLYYPSGVVSKKFTYKAQLATVSAATTPVLKDVVHQYRTAPDTKSKWGLSLQAVDQIGLLNGQDEERSGREIASELWQLKDLKQPVVYEDLTSFSGHFISAMSKTATSALVNTTKGMPRRGRIRVVSAGVSEEMAYTSADGKRILGITRARKGTPPRAYTSAHHFDNHYTVIVTDVKEAAAFTDQEKTEAYVQVSLLET